MGKNGGDIITNNKSYLDEFIPHYGRIIDQYSGTGTFSGINNGENVQFNTSFSFYHFFNGEVIIYCPEIPETISGLAHDRWYNNPLTFEGVTAEGFQITCQKLFQRGDTFNLETKIWKLVFQIFEEGTVVITNPSIDYETSDISVGLSNLFYSGVNHSIILSENISVELKTFETTPFPNSKKDRYPEITSELFFRNVHRDTNVREIINSLTTLCSLFTCEDIEPYYIDHYHGKELICKEIIPGKKGDYHGFIDIIDVSNPDELSIGEILSETYPLFKKHTEFLKLDNAFYYIRKSEQNEHNNLHFILGVVSLEAISFQYCEYLTSIETPIPNKSVQRNFRSIVKIAKKHKKVLRSKFITTIATKFSQEPDFQDKILALLDAFFVPYCKKDIGLIKTRNYIIHRGEFPPGVDPEESKLRISDFLIRIYLSILRYEGNFFSPLLKRYITIEEYRASLNSGTE